jgi:hypothetical protein
MLVALAGEPRAGQDQEWGMIGRTTLELLDMVVATKLEGRPVPGVGIGTR